MKQIKLPTILLGSVSFVALAVAGACEVEYRKYPKLFAGLTPLSVSMTESETVRASFTAVWSEPHYVALVFPANVEPEIKVALHRLARSLGGTSQSAPQLNFDWRVVSAGTEVGRGTGREPPTSAFGSDETAFAFGEFPANAGHTYELEVRRGPAFEPFAHAAPMIEVGVNSPGPSLGLPWVKEFNRPIAVILAVVGLAFFGGAAWSMRERAG